MRMILLVLVLSVFNTQSSAQTAATKDATMGKTNLRWFDNQDCTHLDIFEFKHASDRKPAKKRAIDDKATIQKLIGMIEALPVEGDEMISFGPTVPLTVLEFKCEPGSKKIEFYAGGIKTPATSFFSDKKSAEVFRQVQALLKKR